MKITKIKQIGKTNKYHVYVDDEWFGIFLDETLAREHLQTNKPLEEDFLTKIKPENDRKLAFDMAVSYMEKYITTEKGIKDYLKKKNFDEKIIAQTVDKLKEYGFVDDEKFAKNYFDSLSASKGKRVIANKLRQKGVSSEIVESLLENVDEESQIVLATAQAEKFVKNRQNTPKLKQKCLAHLVYKGYDYSVAQEATKIALKNYEGENDDWV
jgi:regulatory protein